MYVMYLAVLFLPLICWAILCLNDAFVITVNCIPKRTFQYMSRNDGMKVTKDKTYNMNRTAIQQDIMLNRKGEGYRVDGEVPEYASLHGSKSHCI